MTTNAQAYEKLQSETQRLLNILATQNLSDAERRKILRKITIFHNELVRIVNQKLRESNEQYRVLGGAFKDIIRDFLS